jgi:arylsulfatase A-like enzyme
MVSAFARFLLVVLLSLAWSCAKKPCATHVVLIIVDTLRADTLRCYGYPLRTSPEIDALANTGVVFDRVIAQSSWTRPAIGSLITGIYPRTLGLYKEHGETLYEHFDTLPEVFRRNGYTTIGATANPSINTVFGFDQGFDRYMDSSSVWKWMPGFEEKEASRTNAMDTASDIFGKVFAEIGPEPRPPYYVQVNLMEMHTPGPVIEEVFRGAFAEEEHNERQYLSKLRQVSYDIGAFVKRWVSLPGLEDTLFVITSDHGEGLPGDHPDIVGGNFHGYLIYETMARVPLIFYHPKKKLGVPLIERPVRLMDVMPTILELQGLEIPHRIDARSLAPLFEGQEHDVELPSGFVIESYFQNTDKIGVYSGDWKYFEHRDSWANTDPRELYGWRVVEKGSKGNQLGGNEDIAARLGSYLEEWEKNHPKAEPALAKRQPTEREIEQLKALGYLQ